jgi:hypothetical protein
MIDRDEIDATSRLLGVHASDVQRDYLYRWLLAGLYGDSPLTPGRLVSRAPGGASDSGGQTVEMVALSAGWRVAELVA